MLKKIKKENNIYIMKSLRNFILESSEKDDEKQDKVSQDIKKDDEVESQKETVEATHAVTFDFTDLNDSKDIIKSLEEHSDICTITDKKVTVNASKEENSKTKEISDIIEGYVKTLMQSQKRSSNEGYAQKIKSFNAKLNDLKEYISQVDGENNEEE